MVFLHGASISIFGKFTFLSPSLSLNGDVSSMYIMSDMAGSGNLVTVVG